MSVTSDPANNGAHITKAMYFEALDLLTTEQFEKRKAENGNRVQRTTANPKFVTRPDQPRPKMQTRRNGQSKSASNSPPPQPSPTSTDRSDSTENEQSNKPDRRE